MDPSILTLRQLRTELKKRHLSPSGLKHHLQTRLIHYLQQNGFPVTLSALSSPSHDMNGSEINSSMGMSLMGHSTGSTTSDTLLGNGDVIPGHRTSQDPYSSYSSSSSSTSASSTFGFRNNNPPAGFPLKDPSIHNETRIKRMVKTSKPQDIVSKALLKKFGVKKSSTHSSPYRPAASRPLSELAKKFKRSSEDHPPNGSKSWISASDSSSENSEGDPNDENIIKRKRTSDSSGPSSSSSSSQNKNITRKKIRYSDGDPSALGTSDELSSSSFLLLNSSTSGIPSTSTSNNNIHTRSMNRLGGDESFNYSKLSTTQREFFKEASYELQRIQQQTRYEREICKLEEELQDLRTQLLLKEEVIQDLEEVVRQKNEALAAVTGLMDVPKEFLSNWVALEKTIQLFNKNEPPLAGYSPPQSGAPETPKSNDLTTLVNSLPNNP